MISSWPCVKFGSLYKEPSRNGLTKPKKVRGEGYKFINMGEIFAFDRMNHIPTDRAPLTEKEIATSLLATGDLLFARQSLVLSGAGKCSIFLGDKEDVSFESHLIRIRLKSEIVNPEYVFYYFKSQQGRSNISTIVEQGAGQAGIRGSDLEKLDFPLPPREIQDKIVEIIRPYDVKAELNQQTNQTLEQMAQALFKSWFVDFDPVVDNALAAGNPIPDELAHRVEVRQKAHALPASLGGKGQPLPEHIKNLFPSEFEQTGEPTVGIGGWVPKGWDIKPINKVGEIVCGKTPSKSNPDFYGEDVPFIKIPDMHGNMLITETSASLSYEGDSSQPKKRIPKNSICVSCIATVGLVSITTEPSHTNQQINSIVPIDTAQVEYLYFQMKSLNKKFHDLASGGSATLNMNTRTFGSIDILVPNQVVINEFHNRVSSLVSKIELCKRESKQLASIRDSLLPKLISGEIQLQPASKNIQEADVQGA